MTTSRPQSLADPFSTAPNTPVAETGLLPRTQHPPSVDRPASSLTAAETARSSFATNDNVTPANDLHENVDPQGANVGQVQSPAPSESPDPATISLSGSNGVLELPAVSFLDQVQTPEMMDTPQDSVVRSQSADGLNTAPLVPMDGSPSAASPEVEAKLEEGTTSADEALALSPSSVGSEKERKPFFRRRFAWIILLLLALVIVALAVVLPVYFTVIKPHNSSASATEGSGSPGTIPNPGSPSGATSGGNGSTVLSSDGSTFTYINPFGGYWVSDPNNPFNNDARPNSWTPPLNTSWTWGQDKVYGVNLGGLFVLEPFITPSLYQQYPGSVDEWTLSTLMAADTANGGLNQLENHYNTFITEQDIAEIAGAGLNWIRLPIPFWAVEKWDFEPFLEKVCWPYILRVLQWARKYGLRVNLDLHTIPGSQNGYNHSGKMGTVNFLNGVMGVANAERALNYIRIITEFISQPEWQPVVPVFGIVNEALVSTIGMDQLTSFYLRAHDMIRNITGYGEGHGAYISIHDGFEGLPTWAGFLEGSDRIIIDTHPYFAFNGESNNAPIATGTGLQAGGTWPQMACSWGPSINQSQVSFGVTIAGEFSVGYNDCGLYLLGVGNTDSYGQSCALFLDASQWNDTMKAGLQEFALASMDALQNWFFWTWKVGNSSTTNTVQAPLWTYKLGLEQGWIPKDPRTALGTCAALGVSGPIFSGTFQSWQTGGAGAGTIAPASVSSYSQYPPTSISGLTAGAIQTYLPTYTPTGSPIPTLSPPTFSPKPPSSVSIGNGWYDGSDQGLSPTEVAGCSYPNAWDAVSSPMPTALCPSTATSTGGGAGITVTPAPAAGARR
ncbi:glycoside hydrolase family 5 protein [Pisolithus marmoratus]|nr:glycoside hydrolase family 5 protein [Pisolithus marmoratus]